MTDEDQEEGSAIAVSGSSSATPITEKPQRKVLSGKEYRTIKGYIDGINSGKPVSLRQAAIKSGGYNKFYASTAARRVENLMTNNQYVRELMERKGIGLEALVKDLEKISRATCAPSKFDPIGKHPDYMVRQRNAEFRAQILDALPPKRMEIEEKVINITINADTIDKIRAIKGREFFEAEDERESKG